MIANTPAPPYYAVIFTSLRTSVDDGYGVMADLMKNLAEQQAGYLGMESARNELGITVSYWASEEAIQAWKANLQHAAAQERGRKSWYSHYHVRVCKVERAYSFDA